MTYPSMADPGASWRRAALLALAVVAALPVTGVGIAWGHGGSGEDYRSTITAIEPADLPIEVKVVGGDDELRVENVGDQQLVIFGYNQRTNEKPDGWEDPYVRIGPEGVFVNHNATAYYQNQGRYGAPVPDGLGTPSDRPDWQRVREKPLFYSFHDHRIHWMAKSVPPGVDENSPKPQKVLDWEVPLRYGDREGAITGTLTYVGGTSRVGDRIELALTSLAVAGMVVVFGVDWWRRRRRSRGAVVPGSDGGPRG